MALIDLHLVKAAVDDGLSLVFEGGRNLVNLGTLVQEKGQIPKGFDTFWGYLTRAVATGACQTIRGYSARRPTTRP